jgi:hypothetical protein
MVWASRRKGYYQMTSTNETQVLHVLTELSKS